MFPLAHERRRGPGGPGPGPYPGQGRGRAGRGGAHGRGGGGSSPGGRAGGAVRRAASRCLGAGGRPGSLSRAEPGPGTEAAAG